MQVNYLLEDTALFGGVKVALHHAELLHRLGHQVTVVSKGAPPKWFPIEALFCEVEDFSPENVPEADVHVATFWTTVAPAAALPKGQAVHYCQGFEAALEHNRQEHRRILEAYEKRLPAFAVSPHLAALLETKFDRAARVVPPALEPFWTPRRRIGPHRRPRVLVAHPFEFDMKGVQTALQAIRLLREDGIDVRLVRLSQWPLSEAEEQFLAPDEFHHHIEMSEVAGLLAGCDLLLAPSWEAEGFGLTVLEAMACGVPVVASRITAFSGFAGEAAELVPPTDPRAFADAAAAILGDRRRWREMRRSGLAAARPFSEERVASALEDAVRWVASGAWQVEP